ncbi:MAG: chorismate synthase [Planctomycetota bacterium]|nr:chorismate synthase [Planctomycetota bacterium]
MSLLQYRTAGESHGPAMVSIVEGLPTGLPIDFGFIDSELRRRQGGYGRGGRQRIEQDSVEVLAGIRQGRTTAGPLAMAVRNRDSRLDDPDRTPAVTRPRPGHADLAGSMKFLTSDCRDVIERSSARETAARTAAGAAARCLLRRYGIESFAFLRGALDVVAAVEVDAESLPRIRDARDRSDLLCPDKVASEAIRARIRQAKEDRDTVGGLIEIHVFGVPPGLGACGGGEERLDARIGSAVLGVQAMKSVEIGLGRETALRRGSEVHDPISFDEARAAEPGLGFVRPTNHAGGLEGGMSNGMPIVVTAAMKPISTLLKGLPSVDLATRQAETSAYERSDICAAAAASVVLENVIAFEVARAFRAKFAGDSVEETDAQFAAYLDAARRLGGK